MDIPFDFGPEPADRIVYVRPGAVADLPEPLRLLVPGLETLYALHSAEGARLALVRDRKMAFALARENDLAAVSVH